MKNDSTGTNGSKSGPVPQRGFAPPNYTQIPNDLFPLIPHMSDVELRVTLVIARETLGWHKEWSKRPREVSGRHGLSLSALMKLCGLSKPSVQKGIKEGTLRGTIERRGSGDSYIYRLRVGAVSLPDPLDDDPVFDEEELLEEESPSGSVSSNDSHTPSVGGQNTYQGKIFTGQNSYPEGAKKLPSGGQNIYPGGGKNFYPHKEERKETKKQTHTTLKKGASAPPPRAASPPVVVCGSRFSLGECEQYAKHLHRTGQGVNNPGGFARRIHQTGSEDAEIEEFLHGAQPTDTNWRSFHLDALERFYDLHRTEEGAPAILDLKMDLMTRRINREECERRFQELESEVDRQRGAA